MAIDPIGVECGFGIIHLRQSEEEAVNYLITMRCKFGYPRAELHQIGKLN